MKKKILYAITAFALLFTVVNFRWVKYLAHITAHQIQVIWRAEPIDKTLQRSDLPPEKRKLLLATKKIRSFIEKELGLKNSKSYRTYVDLGRDYLGYNITVTPEFSLKPKPFSFWPIGSFDYLGFFSREMAESWAARYRAENADVHLAEFGGYSTLGWFADPLYSTQLTLGEFALARLLAHEIAHERLYFTHDTTTSEILASFIERRLALDYLAASGQKIPSKAEQAALKRRVEAFTREIEAARDKLENLYASPLPAEEKRRKKRVIFNALHNTLTKKDAPYAGLPALRALPSADELGNAWLVQFQRYTPQSSALEALYLKCSREAKEKKYQCWFEKLEDLRTCTKEQRNEWLKGDGTIPDGYCRQ